MIRYLQQVQAERDALTARAVALTNTAADENRDLTDGEVASIQGMRERCAQLDNQIRTCADEADSTRAYAALRSRLPATTADDAIPARSLQLRSAPQSWGELFVRSAEFAGYDGRGTSRSVRLPGLFTRAPIQIDTFPGELPPYQFTPTPWQMTTPLLDALGKTTTTSGSVQWYTWPGAYPEAAVVAEGATKPEADVTPTPHSGDLQTYAHYKAISRQALEDIPQIQSIVENALRGGVLTALEKAAAAALGAAGSGIPSISNADLMTGIRLGIAAVQSRGYAQPNAVLLNPDDFANLDLAIMATTTAGPTSAGSVWGVPPIAVGALPAGTAYVGNFKTAVTLFSRDQVEAYLTDSHADYFVRNLLVILAEQRALVAVTEPDAAEQIVVTAEGAADLT